MLPVLATRDSSSSSTSTSSTSSIPSYHHPASASTSLNSLASDYEEESHENQAHTSPTAPPDTFASTEYKENRTTGIATRTRTATGMATATGTWPIGTSTISHSVVYLLQPQNWTLQMQLGLAIACVTPCAAVSLKVGALVFTGIACLPKVASLYLSLPSTPQTLQATHMRHSIPPRKGNMHARYFLRESPQQDILLLPLPPPAPSDEFLKLKLQWLQDHEWQLETQNMHGECPLEWLIKDAAAEPEKTHYKQHIEYYDAQITRFHCAHKKAMETFETFYTKWQMDLSSALHSHPTTNITRTQLAEECQLRSQLLSQNLLILLKKLYKELLDLRNQYADGVSHPCLTEKINHAFDQAAFNHFSIQHTLEKRVNHLTTSILKNWEAISQSPYIPTQQTACWCVQCVPYIQTS